MQLGPPTSTYHCCCGPAISTPTRAIVPQTAPQARVPLPLPLALLLITALFLHPSAASTPSDAAPPPASFLPSLLPLLSTCTIPRRPLLSPRDFAAAFRGAAPVIFTRPAAATAAARAAGARDALRAAYGHLPVLLASSNSYSHAKLPTTLATYLEEHTAPVPPGARANDTFYLFGDTLGEAWAPLLAAYPVPPHAPPADSPLPAWGAGGAWSGVPFHTHGAAFAETVVGRKYWWVAPPAARPEFDGEETQLAWALRAAARGAPYLHGQGLAGCEIGAGDVIYVPAGWHHATLNTRAYNFFYSVFTQEQAPAPPAPPAAEL